MELCNVGYYDPARPMLDELSKHGLSKQNP
jgi:hypothetical protein